MHLPHHVKYILDVLNRAGFEAYAVGGCVRDSILGRTPEDWDITTSAQPHTVRKLFRRTVDTGIEHGTVTVLMDGDAFEVTTFRIDGEYRDARHPSSVKFVSDLEEDLLRRDFTINAMAYGLSGGLRDPFGGFRDLKQGIIRCVGDPVERFREDALRIMRAVRFSAQLNFRIEEKTFRAARQMAPSLSEISAERICAELTKLITSDHPEFLEKAFECGITKVILPEFDSMMSTPQNNRHHQYNVGLHTIHAMQQTEPDRILRLTMLLHDTGKPGTRSTGPDGQDHFFGHAAAGVEIARRIMRRFRMDNETVRKVLMLIRYHDWRFSATEKNVRKALARIGSDLFPYFIRVRRADAGAQSDYHRKEKLDAIDQIERLYYRVTGRGDCYTLKSLAVNGRDLIGLGCERGPEIGRFLEDALYKVLEDPASNQKEILLDYIQKIRTDKKEDTRLEAKKNYEEWLSNPYFDENTKRELRALEGNDSEIEDRFYQELKFGTAGLRGVIGAGSNRMNIYTVRKATQGLANYIRKVGKSEQGVAISYDSRHMSPEFAEEAALCLAANDIRAYVFESLRPTPELSFAVRHLGCAAGINITASHNPSNYNGYKVYWEDGAQITPPHDTGIMEEIRNIADYSEVRTMRKEEALEKGRVVSIGSDVDDAYMAALKKLVLHPEAIKECAGELKIVYTPLHGTGNIPVRRILSELGFLHVTVVPEQEMPDGDFPTVPYPNPETDEAFALGLKLAKEIDADLILATDPDADRLGVWVKDTKRGGYRILTGNMSGCLLADYEIGQRREKYGLPEDGALISTIVSSDLARAIAESYHVRYISVLTGFKYIGQKILEFETKGTGTYLFGFEESYGCLIGTHARDKDAVAASMALCEAAAYYKTKGMTLSDAMDQLYEKHGYYRDEVKSVTLDGIEGVQKIRAIMQSLRENAPKEIGGCKVTAIRDYASGIIRKTADGSMSPTGLPKADVLYFELEDSAWVAVRPSGTEPKIKFYYGIRGDSDEDAQKRQDIMKKALDELVSTR